MRKIIHLSDLHVGHDECGLRFKEIVTAICATMLPASDYVVVITGDLIENAAHHQHRIEVLEAIQHLKSNHFSVLVLPGNHDYGTGALANKKYVIPFKQAFYDNEQQTYPKVDVIDDVVFIGLDSNADELHWYDRMFAEGEIGIEQLGRLQQIIDDKAYQHMKKVVYMHHHPIDNLMWHQLKDAHRLKRIISNKVDTLLFGHLHRSQQSAVKDLNGTWGIRRVYNAGSATHKNGHTGYHRVIDLSRDIEADYDAKFI
jgi:3',5'-cyclic AMP phosphodiesterase CpdA